MTTAEPTSGALAWTFRWSMREHARALRAVSRHAERGRWVRPLVRGVLITGAVLAVLGAAVDASALYEPGV